MTEDKENKNEFSPGEFMMEVMEKFNGDEPTDIIVIWRSENGNIKWKWTHKEEMENSHRVGILETVKSMELREYDDPVDLK